MNKATKTQAEPQSSVPDFQLRPATQEDFSFARGLYFDSMEPLLSALDAWDAENAENAFRSYFIAEEINVVQLNAKDVGWMQVSVTEKELCLDQIHLMEDVRGLGIGTHLINKVIDEAEAQKRDVSLSLIKGNPSIGLYRRLGFQLDGEDATKSHMLRKCAD